MAHPTLIFVRVVKFDRAEETLSCSFLKVVDVGFPLSRNEDMDLTYILDIKHTVAGETYFLVQGTFYQQVDALKRKKYSAHFMLSASTATEEGKILDSYIQDDRSFDSCAMDVNNKRIVRFVK